MTLEGDIPVLPAEGEDLYPQDQEGQQRVLQWATKVYKTSHDAKRVHQDRWDKYYKMYRSYVKKRSKGDWKSRVWVPIAFYVIETITPRLVAQLPGFIVKPVGKEDAPGAELMETMLAWASDQSDLYIELVKALKSSLIYGTGIMKTSYIEIERFQIIQEDEMQESYATMPMVDPATGQPMTDLNGQPMTQQFPMGSQPTGNKTVVRRPYMAYQGPKAEAVDIENFFIDPMADSIGNARYAIHRVYRDKEHMEKMFEKGVYKRPPEDIWNSYVKQQSSLRRQEMIGFSTRDGYGYDDKSTFCLLECWTPKTVVVIAGGDHETGNGGILLRVERNPYGHAEMPFIRIVDHLVPHEFWGIGEMEPLEGMQDLINKLWNSRIDNVALVLNTMFLAVMDFVQDPSDLKIGPGHVVRVNEGIPLNQAVQKLDIGDVTVSSYNEVAEAERITEKVSGVSPVTAGTDMPEGGVGRTATGLTLMSETGNARFSHKIKMAELTGFKHLARQFASNLQQFCPPEMVIRIDQLGGTYGWETVTADSIGGRFDFDIESESTTQTESQRREQSLSLFQMLAADPYTKPLKIREDLIKVFGVKNTQDYILTPEELAQLQQAQAEQEQAAAQQEAEANA